jgi:hypothetical protein
MSVRSFTQNHILVFPTLPVYLEHYFLQRENTIIMLPLMCGLARTYKEHHENSQDWIISQSNFQAKPSCMMGRDA